MAWQFRNDAPIYTQLVAQIKLHIVAGTFQPGQRLPAVLDFALEAGVNPNTMQRALAELERERLVFSQRTAGRFVTEDSDMIQTIKQELAQQQLAQFFQAMAELGYARAEIVALVEQSDSKEAQNGDSGM